MSNIFVYGHSDDLVEVRGEQYAEVNLYPEPDDPTHFVVSGVALDAYYDGEWTFEIRDDIEKDVVILPNECVDEDKFNDYTEVVVIEESDN